MPLIFVMNLLRRELARIIEPDETRTPLMDSNDACRSGAYFDALKEIEVETQVVGYDRLNHIGVADNGD